MQLLLTIHAAASLSGAARMLDMNQSTISYWLDLMRKRLGDALFVRAATGASRRCAPAPAGGPFQMVDKLREGGTDVVIMPDRITEGDGIQGRTLLYFEDAVFCDPDQPLAAGDLDAFCARRHARIALGPDAGFCIDRRSTRLKKSRRIALQVSDFDSALNLIPATPSVATLPRILVHARAPGLSHIAPPWPVEQHRLMLYWQTRNQTSARHAFWRDRCVSIGKTVR